MVALNVDQTLIQTLAQLSEPPAADMEDDALESLMDSEFVALQEAAQITDTVKTLPENIEVTIPDIPPIEVAWDTIIGMTDAPEMEIDWDVFEEALPDAFAVLGQPEKQENWEDTLIHLT